MYFSRFSYLLNSKGLPIAFLNKNENAHELDFGKEPIARQQELKKLVMSCTGCRPHKPSDIKDIACLSEEIMGSRWFWEI